jgi:pSer/pThr/pTyr-binding forkhead associated (FHA) protein
VQLLERKAAALMRIRSAMRIRALLEVWLFVHVPITFALIAALFVHIISVFFLLVSALTFNLNQISTSAEGREIRRAKDVAGDRLTIGRAPDNHVHLTDLAVALRHAIVTRTGHRLSVAAEEGLGVEINGRKVTSGVIELAQGGELRIASHLLRFLPGPADSQEISVDVERVGESAADEADRADIRRFSVGSVLPGKRISAYVLMALVLGVFLAWPIYVYSERQPVNAAQISQEQRKEDGSGLAEPKQASFSPDTMWSTGSLEPGASRAGGAMLRLPRQGVRAGAGCRLHRMPQGRRSRGAAENPRGEDQALPGFQARGSWLGAVPTRPRAELSVTIRGAASIATWSMKARTRCRGRRRPTAVAATPTSSQRLPDAEVGNASDFGRAHPEFRPASLLEWSEARRVPRRGARSTATRRAEQLNFPTTSTSTSPTGARSTAGQARCEPSSRRYWPAASQLTCSTATPRRPTERATAGGHGGGLRRLPHATFDEPAAVPAPCATGRRSM